MDKNNLSLMLAVTQTVCKSWDGNPIPLGALYAAFIQKNISYEIFDSIILTLKNKGGFIVTSETISPSIELQRVLRKNTETTN